MGLWKIAEGADEATTNVARVSIRYSDVTGTRWTRTHLKFQMKSEGKMDLRQVEFDWTA
jgi:hypothetical protein